MTGHRNDPVIRPSGKRSFRLDRSGGKVAGVCGGIGRYLGIDPLIVRLVFVIGTVVGFGSLALIYLAIWLLAD